jgi:uncharacterized SAM-dependent methyltransferase
MAKLISVQIHESEFPDRFSAEWKAGFRERNIRPKFHYQSHKQTQRWLRLFEAYSPFQRDPGAAAAYALAFEFLSRSLPDRRVVLVGLGCGGGQKDSQLLDQLHAAGKTVSYVPMDVSPGMVITSARRLQGRAGCAACHPVVLDLAQTADLSQVLASTVGESEARILTFFGMIPNFEPESAAARLASVLRPPDLLAFSANLAPGDDYGAGVRRVLPQYDNPPTREWLMTFLTDAGFEREDGELRFSVESPASAPGLLRIVADYHVLRERCLGFEGEEFRFRPGEAIRVFFSYRYTPALVRVLLARHGLLVVADWTAANGEEGLFICRRGGESF